MRAHVMISPARVRDIASRAMLSGVAFVAAGWLFAQVCKDLDRIDLLGDVAGALNAKEPTA